MTKQDSDLDNQIDKCFKDTYMQTEGNTELFDIYETKQAIKHLILQARIDECRTFWNKTQPDIIPEGVEPNAVGMVIKNRLWELENDKRI